MPTSERQLQANRDNAQLSTGPKTSVGKATASQNAVKTGLTGRAILLESGEAAWYEQHVARFARDFAPVGDRETELVQSLADTQWRLNRIPILEAGTYAIGRIQYAELFADQDPELQPLLIENHIFRTHFRELNNLSIQESRLRRHYAKDLSELKALHAERFNQADPSTRTRPPVSPQPPNIHNPPLPLGLRMQMGSFLRMTKKRSVQRLPCTIAMATSPRLTPSRVTNR